MDTHASVPAIVEPLVLLSVQPQGMMVMPTPAGPGGRI
jgi:hypothetical protein